MNAATLLFLLASALLTAEPKATHRPDSIAQADGIEAPLGRVADVVQAPPVGGTPVEEPWFGATFDGCERQQAVYLTRFVWGAAEAAGQIDAWLSNQAPAGLRKRLFPRVDGLVDAIVRSRSAVPGMKSPCLPIALTRDWKIDLARVPAKLCAVEGPPGVGREVLFVDPAVPTRVAAVVKVTPAAADRDDRCWPRISAVLFDSTGQAVVRYHADLGAEPALELLGSGCRGVDFNWNPKTLRFQAVPRKGGRSCEGRPAR